jgi:hypothetical protein
VAVNAQNDIIVADTNNHRIQIFDKEGRFKFQFGEVSISWNLAFFVAKFIEYCRRRGLVSRSRFYLFSGLHEGLSSYM